VIGLIFYDQSPNNQGEILSQGEGQCALHIFTATTNLQGDLVE